MEESREKAIQASLEEWERLPEPQKRTLSVEFRGTTRNLPVITISPTVLLLNHDNYRLAAQLEDFPQRDLIRSSPLSQESQDSLSKLLRETDDYKKLKQQLSDLGQKEAGLITADGLIVNGNTRTVALRDLGVSGVMVGVLPPSVTNEDVLNLQVQLQMMRLVHQDYSFTNQLLLIERVRQLSESDEALIARLGWKPGAKSRSQLAQAKRILSMIREVTKRAGNVHYSIFDDSEEALRDLDKAYEEQKQTDFEKAELMKYKRLIGILSGLTKDQIRSIKADFLENDPEFDEMSSHLKPQENKRDESEDLFGGKNNSRQRQELILDEILNTFGQDGKPQPIDDPKINEIITKMRYETETEIARGRLKKFLNDPIKNLKQATLNLRGVNADFDKLTAQQQFSKENFLKELSTLKNVILEIEQKAKEK